MYTFLTRLARTLPAEKAHDLTLISLQKAGCLLPETHVGEIPVKIAHLECRNPVGLAAGFDKNAEIPHIMQNFGFGFVEVGTVTPRPQAGNPKPRMFRLPEDQAVINRLGFNNRGADYMLQRVGWLRDQHKMHIPLGINVGANKDSEDKTQDYVFGVATFAAYADYLTVNISSPNTVGLRDLQHEDHFKGLIRAVLNKRAQMNSKTPVFFKLAPDLTSKEIEMLAKAAQDLSVDGLILTNTTIKRPESLLSSHKNETGGLSGVPLRSLAQDTLEQFAKELKGQVPLIGVGGITSGRDAKARLDAGASLVQLYTGLVYKGPELVREIVEHLVQSKSGDNVKKKSQAN